MRSVFERQVAFRLWREMAKAKVVNTIELSTLLGASELQVNKGLAVLREWSAPFTEDWDRNGRRKIKVLSVSDADWRVPFDELAAGDRVLVLDAKLAELGHKVGNTMARLESLTAERQQIEESLGNAARGQTTREIVAKLEADLETALASQKRWVKTVHDLRQRLGQVYRLATEGAPGDGGIPQGVEDADVLVAVSEALTRKDSGDLATMLAVVMLSEDRRTIRVMGKTAQVLEQHGIELLLQGVSDGWVAMVRAPGEVWCSECESWVMPSPSEDCQSCGQETVPVLDAQALEAIGSEKQAIAAPLSDATLAWLEVAAESRPELATELLRARDRATRGKPQGGEAWPQ